MESAIVNIDKKLEVLKEIKERSAYQDHWTDGKKFMVSYIANIYEENAPFGLDGSKKKLFKGFLTKPVRVSELGNSLAQLLK